MSPELLFSIHSKDCHLEMCQGDGAGMHAVALTFLHFYRVKVRHPVMVGSADGKRRWSWGRVVAHASLVMRGAPQKERGGM